MATVDLEELREDMREHLIDSLKSTLVLTTSIPNNCRKVIPAPLWKKLLYGVVGKKAPPTIEYRLPEPQGDTITIRRPNPNHWGREGNATR